MKTLTKRIALAAGLAAIATGLVAFPASAAAPRSVVAVIRSGTDYERARSAVGDQCQGRQSDGHQQLDSHRHLASHDGGLLRLVRRARSR